MKIILTTSMRGLGGTETATLRLGRLLCQRGHDVILASSDGPLVEEAKAAGMRHYLVDFYNHGKKGYWNGMLAFRQILQTEQPDIVHCQMARIVPACAAAVKMTTPHAKVFYHARGLNPQTYPKIAKLFDWLGVSIIANCQHERQKLIRHGFPAQRISYTYNALPETAPVIAKTQRDEIVLGTLSRLDKVRAVHLLLPMFKQLLDKGLAVRLKVAGEGDERAALEEQAQTLGIADKVEFLGAVRDLAHYFSEVDILANTLNCAGDHGAGIGNNILEAGLYHTPVVTYDVAGIAEMVQHDKTGYCVPLRDDETFVAALESLIKRAELRQQFGDALHQRVLTLCSDDEIYRTTLAAYQMGNSLS